MKIFYLDSDRIIPSYASVVKRAMLKFRDVKQKGLTLLRFAGIMSRLSSEIACGVSGVASVEERVKWNTLLDFYGPMLTEHRREVLRLYCEEDLSLAEIAEQLGITRQGVSDALQKGRRQLADFEAKLGLAGRYRALGERARFCLQALDGVRATGADAERIRTARGALEEILRER